MKKVELIFIPAPGVGHLVAIVEISKLLLLRDERFFITILIMKFPIDLGEKEYLQSLNLEANSNPCLRFIELPEDDSSSDLLSKYPHTFFFEFFNMQKRHVRDVVNKIINTSSESSQVAALVLDFACTAMIDVANELGLPSYVFFTSSAAFLGLVLHLQTLRDVYNQDVSEFKNSNSNNAISVPPFVNPLPTKLFPDDFVKEGPGSDMLFDVIRRIRDAKGIMVNTFFELESHPIQSLREGNFPAIYPVGPILNSKPENNPNNQHRMIMEWLDDQPCSSVVFLCFGSMGCFDVNQVKEIAQALENSGHRFLWSLRRPPEKGKIEFPSDYQSLEGVLPDGFLERTRSMGKVIGWAPQLAVLSHPAVGGFVSHCGWNSSLESIWCGVPMATWPLRADQQMNAFQLVKELGVAAEIRMDYRKTYEDHCVDTVSCEEIENGIRQVMMNDGSEIIRNKMKDMKHKCRIAIDEGGSSYNALSLFIKNFINDIHE